MAWFDLVVVGGTPGGIMAAIAAAREGKSTLLLERTAHVGGLVANGLGATDIATRGCTGGLFMDFVSRVKHHYVTTYGEGSQQVKDASDGYHFEPQVAERVLHEMLAAQPSIVVRTMQQFDALPANVKQQGGKITQIAILDRTTGKSDWVQGKVFIDATYEGDLAAAAGCPWRTRREGQKEYNEPLAGRVFKAWGAGPVEVGPGSTGEGDDTIQAYNYRLCLTDDPSRRVTITQPEGYRREEYASIIDDILKMRYAGKVHGEWCQDGIGRVVNIVRVPNGKSDSNNQHLAFVSTDLPEENYPWPTADWAWRDNYAIRLRNYTLGLLWFAQNDPALPAAFREKCRLWGLAQDEYADNGFFPRQVYVREGRRIEGKHLFTALDAISIDGNRPPIYANSITSSHYALDSHAHHKRDWEGGDHVHLDGFLSHPTKPYTVPYGVIVPREGPGNLLTPVPVSATHIGFSTLRMEPCWMAMGEAAGTAAALLVDQQVAAAEVPIKPLQEKLLSHGAVLIYFKDAKPGDADFARIQMAGLNGELKGWMARV